MRKIFFLFLFVLASCSTSPSNLYVEADQATYDVVAPEYLKLVRESKDSSGDATFDKDQIERRERLIESWKIRIEEAKTSAEAKK